MSFTLVWPSDEAGQFDVTFAQPPVDPNGTEQQYRVAVTQCLHEDDRVDTVWLNDKKLRIHVLPWPPTQVHLSSPSHLIGE
jgi:hypothetical protein